MSDIASLQAAFEASGLERKGWTFDRAMQDPTLSWSLKHQADRRAARVVTQGGGHVEKSWNGTVNGGTCRAVQHSDQMCCGKCGLAWDVNDPEPPECGNTAKGLG